MPDPAWPSSPPEVNYLKLAGSAAAGAATTLASAAAWQALMAGNELAFSLSAVNTAVTAPGFEGLGGAASSAAVTGLNAALQLLAGWAQEKPPIAASAVGAYEAALSSMIPADVSLANRAEQASDVALNPLVFGALTPAIVALDTAYFGEHWPHNAGAGAAYGAALAALVPALAVPPPPAPPGASPAAPASAAAAVAEAAGQAAGNMAAGESGQVTNFAGDAALPAESAAQIGQLASGMVQPLMGMFQAPIQASQAVTGLPQSMMGQFGGLIGGASPRVSEVPAGLEAAPAAAFGSCGSPTPGFGGTGGAAIGVGGSAGAGAVPPAGLTSFTRPTSGFTPESSARPVGLRSGLLAGPDLRGPTTSTGGGAVPLSPAHAGPLGQGKGESPKEEGPRARIVVPGDRWTG